MTDQVPASDRSAEAAARPRRGRTRVAVAAVIMAVFAAVAAVLLVRAPLSPGGPPPFRAGSEPGLAGFDAEVGVVGIVGLSRIEATAPFTLVAVRPEKQDRAVNVLAVRAIFHGRGISPSGHRMFSGYPLVTCWRTWPVPGFGPSYPVESLAFAPGDVAQLVFYVRSDRPGARWMEGYEIEYRDARGRLRKATGDTFRFEMHLHGPGEEPTPDHEIAPCHPDRPNGWVRVVEGFPR